MPASIDVIIKKIVEENDAVSFKQFYQHFFPGIFSFANSILKNKHNAEDVVEDVFFYIWEHRHVLSSLKNVSAYMYVATKNACLKFLKERNLIKDSGNIDLDDLGEEVLFKYVTNNALNKANYERINSFIENLPPKRRLIFKLIKEDGLSYKEVSSLLDISVKTVENQMLIAFKQIANVLRAEFPEYNSYFKKTAEKK